MNFFGGSAAKRRYIFWSKKNKFALLKKNIFFWIWIALKLIKLSFWCRSSTVPCGLMVRAKDLKRNRLGSIPREVLDSYVFLLILFFLCYKKEKLGFELGLFNLKIYLPSCKLHRIKKINGIKKSFCWRLIWWPQL